MKFKCENNRCTDTSAIGANIMSIAAVPGKRAIPDTDINQGFGSIDILNRAEPGIF